MFRRSILQFSSRHSFKRIPVQAISQVPSYLSSRKEFSVTTQQRPESEGKPPESGNSSAKIVIGSAALGGAFVVAYRMGYLDKYLDKESHGTPELTNFSTVNDKPMESSESDRNSQANEQLGNKIAGTNFQDSNLLDNSSMDKEDKGVEAHSEVPVSEDGQSKDLSGSEREGQLQGKNTIGSTLKDINHRQEEDLSGSPNKTPDVFIDKESTEVKPNAEQEVIPTYKQAEAVRAEEDWKSASAEHVSQYEPEGVKGKTVKEPGSLLDEYYLGDDDGDRTTTAAIKDKDLQEGIVNVTDGYISHDGKLVLDFLQAIHAAERRQAELDARSFAEEKKMMKENYEKELRDARARELMYAEREAILDKELNKERIRATAAIKSLKEELEGKHKMELEQKEIEVDLKLKEIQELAKAKLAAAIASEKASQIEKMAEANLHINALCMAFYARSEEARQSHSVHKLALGALALEDALSKGQPIRREIEALHTYLEGVEKDSLLDLVLSYLPDETREHGTDTLLQLNHKFDTLKGTLRHFSLIPPGGGGILAHSLAHLAASLKVKEADESGDGIDSLINKVEGFLAQGKLTEAADTLENGVRGTQAAEIVDDWIRSTRNRAITEQALTLLQSYATSISLT